MKKRVKKAVSLMLSVCLLCSLLPISGWPVAAVEAAGTGGLQNGTLAETTDGWTITEGWGEIQSGCLNLWNENAGTYAMSQTVENLAAGTYSAKAAIVGSGEQGASESKDNLNLTVKNNTTSAETSVKLTTNGWDNWNNVISTEEMEIAEGDSVTITIGGELEAGEWYQIKNVSFSLDETVKNAPITVQKVENLSEDFIHGVDVSMYLSEMQSGVKYYDENGNEQNLFYILRDKGVNWVRLRLWNCPYRVDENGDYIYVDKEGTEYQASQVTVKKPDVSPEEATEQKEWEEYFLADGTQVYREGYGAGNCGIDTVTAIGEVATEYGMKVLIDFHYSDFWADPNNQTVPKAWKGMDLEQKAEALSAFTTESLNTLISAGVDVEMVQIGNEINNGMAGETSLANIHTLLKAGSAAVRGVDENIQIAIHYTDPQSESYQYGKAEALQNAGVDYDVFATSFYPFWHGTPEQLTNNLKVIADTFDKKVMVAEISYPWTYGDGDGYPNGIYEGASDQTFAYSVDVEGQATAIRDAIAAVAAVGEKGIGTFYWEPAWVPVNNVNGENAEEALARNKEAWKLYGSGWVSIYAKDETDSVVNDDDNGSEWDNQAFFDFDGKALPSLNVYKWVYTGADGPKRVSTVDTASYEMGYKGTPNLPAMVNAKLNNGTEISVPVTWAAADVEALKTADFGEYTITGSIGAFSYHNGTEETQVPAGTWTTTCLVKITGDNYVENGSFEDNDGDGSGWTLSNNQPADENNGVFIEKNSANAKDGMYYYTGWASKAMPLDFSLEQTISKTLPNGYYTLLAWYQGTSVGELTEDSGLYAVVTYKDGTVKNYKAKVVINNVWKDFYKAIVKDIPVDGNVTSVKVGTRISCAASDGLAPWVVVDDVNLMRQGDLPTPTTPSTPGTSDTPSTSNTPGTTSVTSYTVTFKDGTKVLSTQKVKPGQAATAPTVTKTGYSLTWDKPFQNVTGDMTINAVWTANKYKITYKVNGGNKLKTNTKTVTYGAKYGTLALPKRAGYTFLGWYTAKTKGTKITAKSIVKITSNTALYAHWQKVAKPAKVKKVTVKNPSKNTMKVSYQKVKGADGYQITYSRNKNFKKSSTKSTAVTKLNKSIKKLKKGKTYYVKVRAYKKDSAGKKVYGSYSAVKTITIKK